MVKVLERCSISNYASHKFLYDSALTESTSNVAGNCSECGGPDLGCKLQMQSDGYARYTSAEALVAG